MSDGPRTCETCGVAFKGVWGSQHCPDHRRGYRAGRVPERNAFAVLLRQYREARGRSRNSLAIAVPVDSSYLTRIEAGDRVPPSPPIIGDLARVLKLSDQETDKLYAAAGYLPPSLLGEWPTVVGDLALVLGDYRLSGEVVMGVSDAVGAICAVARAGAQTERRRAS